MRVIYVKRLIVCVFLLVSTTVFSKEPSWDSVYSLIESRFPKTPTISTEQLSDKLNHNERLVIIDAREPDEYAISHLHDAINATDMKSIEEIVADKNAEIVFYCSVGYRSAAMTKKAIKAGYNNAVNLKGSIFQWANEGRAVYSGKYEEQPASQVHPFNKKWGVLLDEKYRSK